MEGPLPLHRFSAIDRQQVQGVTIAALEGRDTRKDVDP
jgi:hypothetical protein